MSGVHVLTADGTWEQVGTLAENDLWDTHEVLAHDQEEPVRTIETLSTEPLVVHGSIPDWSGDLARVLFGDPSLGDLQNAAVTVSQTVPDLPAAPRKRRRLTGKAYRQARRAHRRARQVWERAGRPHHEVVSYFPNVRVRGVEPVAGTNDCYSIGCEVVGAPTLPDDSPWWQL